MPDYKSMYFKLFNRVTDVIELLQEAQREAEEAYMNDDNEVIPLRPD